MRTTLDRQKLDVIRTFRCQHVLQSVVLFHVIHVIITNFVVLVMNFVQLT